MALPGGKSLRLEIVDERDDRAGVDAHGRAELALHRALARAEHVEHREQGRGEAERLEGGGRPRMGGPPETEEQLPGELRYCTHQ